MKTINSRLFMVFFLLVLVTVGVAYSTFDAHVLANLSALRVWSIVLALGLLAAGMYFDGLRLQRLAAIAGESITLVQAAEVVFGNYFLALVTPGATGGPLAQVAFLREAGVPVGKAAALSIIRTFLSLLILALFLPIVVYADPGIIPWLSRGTAALLATAIPLAGLLCLWLFRLQAFENFVCAAAKFFLRSKSRAAIDFYRDLRAAMVLLYQHRQGVMIACGQTFLSLLALYTIVPAIFAGMGAQVPLLQVLGRLVVLNFLLYFAPTPGGTGVAEGGFIYLFGGMFPPSMVGITAILWRMFAEYLPFAIGMLCVIRVFGYGALKNKILTANEGGNR